MRNRIYAVLALFLLSCAAMAQTTRIKGSVIGPDGKPLEGAQVLLQGSKESGNKYTLKTNKKGEFFSLGIVAAPYAMTISKSGAILYSEQVTVQFDDTKNLFDIDLRKVGAAAQAAGGQEQQGGEAAGAAAPQAAAAAPAEPQKQSGPIDLCAPGVTLTDEQLSKLTPEQKKTFEECQRVHRQNAQIKNINAVLKQAASADEAGNPEQAAEALRPVTQNNPTFALPWVLLGNYESRTAKKMTDATQKQHLFEQAAADMQKGIELAEAGVDPKVRAQVPNWRLNYGTVLESARKHDEAIKVFDQVAQEAAADPKAAALANYNAGVAATNAGKADVAVQYFDKATSLDPAMADAYYQKGVALMGKATTDKSGKFVAPPGTEDAFQKYLELAPTGPNADGAKAMLESMGSKVATGYKKK